MKDDNRGGGKSGALYYKTWTDDPGPVEKQKILKARAVQLAKEDGGGEDSEICLEVVEFVLSREVYALELVHVREVYPVSEITQVPCTPSFVLGIINFRGQILSIVDFKILFDLPQVEASSLNRAVILHSDAMEFGILADEIIGVKSVPLSNIQPSLPTIRGIGSEFLKGVTKDYTVILDGEKILTDKSILVRHEVD